MAGSGDTFTVEILGFPDRTLEEAAAALSGPLGIPADKAAEVLGRLPAIVKDAVPAAGAQQLARNLLGAGADVRLTHVASGKSRVYEARSVSRDRAAALKASLPPGPGGAAGRESRPSGEQAEKCVSCRFEIPAGKQTCPRCGWDTVVRQRRCIRCGGEIVAGTTRLIRSQVVGNVIGGIATAAAAAASFYVGYAFGLRAAFAAFLVYLGVAFAFIIMLVDLRCRECHQAPSKAFLGPEERSRLMIRRVASLVVAVICLGVGALLGYPYLDNPTFELQSEGGVYSAILPRTHQDVEGETVQVHTPLGRMEADMLAAVNQRADVAMFAMFHFRIPDSLVIEDEASRWELLRHTLEGAVKNVGCAMNTTSEMIHYGAPGLEGTFDGTYEETSISGRARAFIFEREIVMLIFAGHEGTVVDDEHGIAFFDTFKAEPR
jgi:hypothetical protein